MSYGQSKLYAETGIVDSSDVLSLPVAISRGSKPAIEEARQEIQTLRAINARLVREVSALREREAQAQRLAHRDGLTGLYNRRRMLELLTAAVQDAARLEQQVAVLFIDLNGFKAINDRLGHAAGDHLLMTVAGRISTRSRAADSVCRYGGDEFVVTLPKIRDEEAAFEVAQTIRKRVAMPVRLNGRDVRISCAIGTAVFPRHGLDAEALLQYADAAMYREKTSAERRSRVGNAAPTRRHDDRWESRIEW